MTNNLGATSADWGHLDMVLGLGGNLLPVVCDPNAVPAADSKVKKFGKIPSAYNRDGFAHGIAKWASRDILDNEMALWRQDPRLGICVRTGSKSGVYAIDVDIEDPAFSAKIDDIIPFTLGVARTRSNSEKFLVAFEIEGRPPLAKRVIKTEHGIIEFLTDGQEFVAVGTHPSGARYSWGIDGLPNRLQTITLAEFEILWAQLATLGTASQVRIVTGTPDEGRAIEGAESGILTTISAEELERVKSALDWPRMKERDNDLWSDCGYALLSLGALGRRVFCEWSKSPRDYKAEIRPEDWWDAHASATPRSDYRHIYTLARQRGWGATAATSAFDPVIRDVPDGVSEGAGETRDPLDIETAPAPRPMVSLVKGQKSNIVRHLIEIISPDVFKQGKWLVRIDRPDDLRIDDGIERSVRYEKDEHGVRVRQVEPWIGAGEYRSILMITSSFIEVLLGDKADFRRYDGRSKDWVVEDCPTEFAKLVMGLGDWPRIRPLDAIARAPFMRADGTVCDVAGYDSRSRTMYIPNADFPPLPETITREMAHAALQQLLQPFREFPHASPASESAFAAHVLSEVARSAIRTSPMFWYTAPDPGTGKTLLSEMPSAIVHGVQPAARPWVSESEEVRKTLFASLIAGDRSIMFDNVPSGRKARCTELCAFLTSPVWEDRKLGASEVIKIPNRAILSASGNNVTPVGDLARRSIVARLDANSKMRKQRRFEIADLRTYVAVHRVELLMAALTVLAGWQQSKSRVCGMPVPLPSFEDWSQFVRDPLIWLGMADPVDTQDEETDDEAGALDGAFERLGAHFRGKDFTSASVRDFIYGFSDTNGDLSQIFIASGCTDPNSPLKIGYWLRDCRDKIAGGYKLVRSGLDKHSAIWVLKPVNAHEDLI